ncbi:TPA_asm: N [Pinellia alphacytorhabdovirus 1]|nr:TPA_asm: N [Pinellia alphacytorhabdovirus 1]
MSSSQVLAARERLAARKAAAAAPQAPSVAHPKPAEVSKPKVAPASKAPVPKSTNTAYDDLEKITVSLRNTPKVWDDNHMETINILGFTRQEPADIIHLGKAVFSSISTGTFLSSDVDALVNLAISIIKPDSRTVENAHMLIPLPEKIGHVVHTPTVDAGSGVESARKKAESKIASVRRTIPSASAEARVKLEALVKKLESDLNNMGTTESPDNTTQGVQVEEAFAYAYLAAYCMRLPGKTPSSWVEKLETAKRRFANWYDHRSAFLESFTISEDHASALKDALARKQEWISTWIVWVAYNESENKDMNPNAKGMLRYLATQMYSYTALHAYSYIVQIQSESGVSFKVLLSQLDCPATRSAVREVANIIRKYEITEAHPERKTYFRYARVWDSGYFSSLQTSQCKILARVAGRTQQMLSSKADGSDPTGAYALKNMDPKLIKTLDEVSDRLFEVIMEATTNDEQSGGIWKNSVLLNRPSN